MESPRFTDGRSRLIDTDAIHPTNTNNNHHIHHHHHHERDGSIGSTTSSYGSHETNGMGTGSPSFNRVKKSTWSIRKNQSHSDVSLTGSLLSTTLTKYGTSTATETDSLLLPSSTTNTYESLSSQQQQQQQQPPLPPESSIYNPTSTEKSSLLQSSNSSSPNSLYIGANAMRRSFNMLSLRGHNNHNHTVSATTTTTTFPIVGGTTTTGLMMKGDDGQEHDYEREKLINNRSKGQGQSEQHDKDNNTSTDSTKFGTRGIIQILIYAVVNVIIAVPALIGYASIIFNHDIYQDHMNALSKLVVLSSAVHQIGFTCFSTIPFAIGTVQDAGLIFLSTMSTIIATVMINDGHSQEEIVSTAIVLLPLGTATLGIVLIIMGYFRLADAVSYLPMPVVGGYLAFIGYFCLMAGVGLCIGKNMSELSDWKYLLDIDSLILAIPGLVAGLVLSLISRYSTNDVSFPAAMVLLPTSFYCILGIFNITMDDARDDGWVGPVTAPVPVQDLFTLCNFSLVRWDLITNIFPTWFGMVFVVSFASCLDVAAISMDMGKALDTNKELMTVGICNTMSGLSFGYTGSYIFSQTIFTYRTGLHTRWIGALCVACYGYVVMSPVNILEVTPLFFLGSTLIFIGFDLLYEWMVEIRERIFLSEYCIVWATFIAIQVVGMDAGILIGILVSIVDHVVYSATMTGVYRVNKQSRAIWTPEEYKIIQDYGYSYRAPSIVALEVVGSVFFGSSFMILQRIADEIGIDLKVESTPTALDSPLYLKSPNRPNYFMHKSERPTKPKDPAERTKRAPASFVVLDLTKVTNLDASAARGCFLQLAKVCQKQGIVVCACGASVRIEWMLRSHEVAYSLQEEEEIKARYSACDTTIKSERLLLFFTIHEALQFCEHKLVLRNNQHELSPRDTFLSRLAQERRQPLSGVFGRILSSSPEEINILRAFDGQTYHSEHTYDAGEEIFRKGSESDCFNVVISGAVAVAIAKDDPRHGVYKNNMKIVSGAGPVQQKKSSSALMEPSIQDDHEIVVASVWPVGGVFGYVDFLLGRPRNFTAVATQDGTVVAKMSRRQIQTLQSENPELDGFLQRVLLQASLLDLANCTCDE